MPDQQKTIAIIGAGIVGVATAIWLQRDGHKVILIDKVGPAAGTSYGNAGLLASAAVVPVTVPGTLAKAPAMLLDPDQPLFLKWRYLPRLLPWLVKYLRHSTVDETKRIAAALYEITGDSVADHLALAAGTDAAKYIVPCDYSFVYANRKAFEKDAFGWGIRRDLGFTWTELEGDAFHADDPAFGPDQNFAVQIPNHGRITDPGAYVTALADHFRDQGGDLVIAEVKDIIRDGNRVTGVRTNGKVIACDAAVLTSGVWSGPLAKKLGVNVPLESERGYHVELWNPSFIPKNPSMIAAGKFVATPMDGRLRLAGIVEFGGLAAPPSKAPVELLLRHARAAFPGLTWDKATEWMGHRPSTDDSLPVIGEAPDVRGAYLGFGHQHIGLTAGPKTGRLLAQLISGRMPNVDLTPYSPARYQ